MNARAYYNEIDPFAAQWLRNLIAGGHVAPGDVDERSIVDVRPDDLTGYSQCHFFAGIGIWSAALRDAGYRDSDHVWTGSCPCQPFSAAGQRGGFADERHLWPAFFHLIEQCRPAKVFGEQVASPAGLQWLDLVSADLEGARYAVGAADLCAAGVAVAAGDTEIGQSTLEWIRGAVQSCPDPFLAAELRDYAEWFDREAGVGPAHIRQRLCWVAYATVPRSLPSAYAGIHRGEESAGPWNAEPVRQCDVSGLADSARDGRREERQIAGRLIEGDRAQGQPAGLVSGGAVERMANSNGRDTSAKRQQPGRQHRQQPEDGRAGARGGAVGELGNADDARSQGRSEHRDGTDQRTTRPASLARWSRADWIICTDGKARPVEPGTFPLAHGQSNRVGRLRAYGNAMHRAKIATFISAADEAIGSGVTTP